jgi:hypothetical protein
LQKKCYKKDTAPTKTVLMCSAWTVATSEIGRVQLL